MDFNYDKVVEMQPVIQVIAIVSLIISCILLVAYLKWRRAADFIIYEQMNFQTLLAFIPSDTNNYYNAFAHQVSFQGFMFCYTDSSTQIIYLCLNQLCWLMLPQYIVYKDAPTAEAILVKIFLNLFQFATLSLFAMLFIYIAMLHKKMRTYNHENVKLLDGMHEGLLIVQKQNLGGISKS